MIDAEATSIQSTAARATDGVLRGLGVALRPAKDVTQIGARAGTGRLLPRPSATNMAGTATSCELTSPSADFTVAAAWIRRVLGPG